MVTVAIQKYTCMILCLAHDFLYISARVKWTTKELQELNYYFEEDMKLGRNVKEKKIMEAIASSKEKRGNLHRRKWETIKAKVNYIILKEKRQKN